MDPVQKIWMYNHWVQDRQDDVELAKNHAYLLGSFHNPEAVKKLMDDSNKFSSSDEDFEKTTKLLSSGVFSSKNNKKRNRKRRLKK